MASFGAPDDFDAGSDRENARVKRERALETRAYVEGMTVTIALPPRPVLPPRFAPFPGAAPPCAGRAGRYELEHVSDEALHAEVKTLAGRYNVLTAELLAHLAEVDARGIYRERACSSLLEAKQGSEAGAQKLGTAKRETPAWNIAMKDAYGQALKYARTVEKAVPFLIACDLGYCFDLYAVFDGSRDYRPFPDARSSRIFFKDLAKDEKHRNTLRKVFLEPYDLDRPHYTSSTTFEPFPSPSPTTSNNNASAISANPSTLTAKRAKRSTLSSRSRGCTTFSRSCVRAKPSPQKNKRSTSRGSFPF